MSTDNTASICYIMKNAAFIAADSLSNSVGKTDVCRLLTNKLLADWFAAKQDDVAVWADGLLTPMVAHQKNDGFSLDSFARGIENYDGRCFAVSSFSGTTAFERGLFDACISVAYLEGRRLLAAVVYDPVHVELFHAIDGLGAYVNGKRISPAATKRLSDAYVSIGHSALRAGGESMRSLLNEAAYIRVGAPCGLELCYTACGRTDAAILRNEAFYDYAAGVMIAKEAGAALLNGDGTPFAAFEGYGERRSVTAACPAILGDMSGYLAQS